MALRFPRDRINTGNTNKYQVPLPVDALSRTLDRAVPQKPSTTFPYSYAPVQSAFSSQVSSSSPFLFLSARAEALPLCSRSPSRATQRVVAPKAMECF